MYYCPWRFCILTPYNAAVHLKLSGTHVILEAHGHIYLLVGFFITSTWAVACMIRLLCFLHDAPSHIILVSCQSYPHNLNYLNAFAPIPLFGYTFRTTQNVSQMHASHRNQKQRRETNKMHKQMHQNIYLRLNGNQRRPSCGLIPFSTTFSMLQIETDESHSVDSVL